MDEPDDDGGLRDYLRELSNTPIAPRPPIAVSETALPPLTQFFNDPPASTQLPPVPSPPSGSGIANPVGNGFYGRKMTSGVGTWVKELAPVLPAVVPATKVRYVLTQDTDGTFAWERLTTVTQPNCDGDTLVDYDVLAIPPA